MRVEGKNLKSAKILKIDIFTCSGLIQSGNSPQRKKRHMTDETKRILLPRQHHPNFCQRDRNCSMQIYLKPDPQNPITTWHQLTPLSSQNYSNYSAICCLLPNASVKCAAT